MCKALGSISSTEREETGKDRDFQQRQKRGKERQRANIKWRFKKSKTGGQGANPWRRASI